MFLQFTSVFVSITLLVTGVSGRLAQYSKGCKLCDNVISPYASESNYLDDKYFGCCTQIKGTMQCRTGLCGLGFRVYVILVTHHHRLLKM